jgi:hypothetical protein
MDKIFIEAGGLNLHKNYIIIIIIIKKIVYFPYEQPIKV